MKIAICPRRRALNKSFHVTRRRRKEARPCNRVLDPELVRVAHQLPGCCGYILSFSNMSTRGLADDSCLYVQQRSHTKVRHVSFIDSKPVVLHTFSRSCTTVEAPHSVTAAANAARQMKRHDCLVTPTGSGEVGHWRDGFPACGCAAGS